jgi:hypothetical protein
MTIDRACLFDISDEEDGRLASHSWTEVDLGKMCGFLSVANTLIAKHSTSPEGRGKPGSWEIRRQKE